MKGNRDGDVGLPEGLSPQGSCPLRAKDLSPGMEVLWILGSHFA
jgi:hypothetical protein